MIKALLEKSHTCRSFLSIPRLLRWSFRLHFVWGMGKDKDFDSIPGARDEFEGIEEYVYFPPDVYKADLRLREQFKGHPDMYAVYMKAHKLLRIAHGLDRENDAQK